MTAQAFTPVSRQALLQQIMTGVAATNHLYAAVFPTGINPQPIPSFGDPLSAEFATFGMNPAAAELTWQRWPLTKMTAQQIDIRLTNYFLNKSTPPNKWFDGYERPTGISGPNKALNLLGRSYRIDTVHLDFSPRATIPRATIAAQVNSGKITKTTYNHFVQTLRAMVAADLSYFFSALALCRNLKAAIMAGSITGDTRDYLDNFLQSRLPPPYSMTLRPPFGPSKRGATALYDLVGPNLNIPVLFVSASPSGDKGKKIATEVQQHLYLLKKLGF